MLEQIGDWVNRLVWGPATLGALLMIGIYYTVRSRFFPFRRLRLWWKETAGGFFRKPERTAAAETGKKGISSFQAMTAALAGAMGTGNIVGVAAALAIGGPGAIFWMWVAALFGMMTIFGENVLGCRYRQKNKKGSVHKSSSKRTCAREADSLFPFFPAFHYPAFIQTAY